MRLELVVGLGSLVLTPFLLWAAGALAPWLGLVADPRRVRFYDRRLPVVGGTCISLGALIPTAAAMYLWNEALIDVVLPPSRIRAITFGLVLSVAVLVLLALHLDRRQSRGYGMWPAVLGAALLAGAYGARFDELSVPFVGEVDLGLANVLVTTLWVILVVSMVELLDTIPGCANLVIAVVSGGLWFGLLGQQWLLAPVFTAACACASLAALPWTTLRPTVLLGKSGNKVLGFVFAMQILLARQKMNAVLFVIIPVAILLVYAVLMFVLQFGQRLDLRERAPGRTEG